MGKWTVELWTAVFFGVTSRYIIITHTEFVAVGRDGPGRRTRESDPDADV